MKNKKSLRLVSKRQIITQLLVGVLIMVIVFMISASSDMKNTENALLTTTSYIKEQCNRYARTDLAAETKSLMRVIESCGQISHKLVDDAMSHSVPDLPDCARESYVSGILLLDPDGAIVSEYHASSYAPELLPEYLDSPALIGTASCPEKRYAVRFYDTDGCEVDLAATARVDEDGIIVAYYSTPVEYLDAFRLSVSSFLCGYTSENNATVMVSSGDTIVASNDESLIGVSTNDIAIIRRINAAKVRNTLWHAGRNDGSEPQYFGLMQRGRDFYVYSFIPERNVFGTAPRVMLYALIFYIAIVFVINAVRWRTVQVYREEQLEAQKEYARSLCEKNEQLSAAVSQADRANAAKTGFLSRMSHDMRTPLNGIIGLLEIDAAHPDDAELVNANREKMRIAANHLLSLINDVLQMSRLESGGIVIAHEPMDLGDLSKDVLTIIEQRAADYGITLEYDKDSDTFAPCKVYGSPLHLRQIFLNIYTNCIKYNKVGGKVRTSLKCLGVDNNTVIYRWTISDTGIGISEEFLGHIFEPFAQERSDVRSVYQGTWLGMTIVKNLVEKMNGTIGISSTEGVGTTFVITIPFEISDKASEKPQQIVAEESSIRGLNLMLVEDNDLNAEIAEMLLTDEGAHITVVNDGKQAVELYRKTPPGTFDAILMDVMMPVMDGYTATKLIRETDRPDAATIPIIAMTANAFAEDAKKCIAAGMNAHLAKPLQINAVKRTIHEQTSR